MRRLTIGVLVPISSIALLMGGACGGGDDTPKVPNGGEASISEDLPGNFPNGLPQYDGADLLGSYAGSQGGIEGTVVSFETDDSVEDVIAFYEEKFSDGPWEQTANSSSTTSGTFAVQNEDTAAYIYISETEGKTAISIAYGERSDSPGD